MASIVVSEVVDAVVVVTLDRPERKNALSIALRDEVSDALAVLAEDRDVKVLIITGAGDTFSAGFDLGEFTDDAELSRVLWASSDRFHHAVLRFPVPVVAAVNGPALAGGFDLAVLCDIRVASRRARFAHPEQGFAPVVYAPLHDLVGGAIARELCFTGRSVDADEALRLRLVSSVVDDDALADEARRVASLITRAQRDALVSTKRKALARAGIDERTATLDL